jgi:enhancing lycopene biosynthesis protein 2
VHPDAEATIRKAFEPRMPIGALCIAPALLAKVLGKSTLTIGTDNGTAQAIEKLGATHQVTQGSDVVVDLENKIVTTPCYMLDSSISVVAKGAENAVQALLNLLK